MIGRGRVLHEGPLGDLLVADQASVSLPATTTPRSRSLPRSRSRGRQAARRTPAHRRLTVIEVGRLARDRDLLLTHLSAAMASLEERFAAITEQHVDYRAGLHRRSPLRRQSC